MNNKETTIMTNDECNLIVIRAEHNKNFKTIDLTCVNDPRLSWKAKGIFNYLTTRPPLWQSKMHDLINKSPEGMSALNSGIKELIKYGYVFRIVKRTNSSVIKWGYLTSEIPCSKEKIENLIPDGYKLYEYKALCEKALVENPLVENPLVENRIVYNNKEKESNKERTNNEDSEETSSKEEVSETDVSHPASSKLHKRSKGQMLMSAKLSVKPLKEKKPVKPYEASSKAEHLMKYWKGKGLYLPKIETKSYQNALISFDKLLSGKAFNGTEFDNYENKKIDIKEIRKAIDRFAYMALNPDYEPREINFKQSLSKMTPTDFIFNPYFKTNNGYGRSKFINCLENEPKLIREKDVFVEDKYPITSKKVANQFKERILGGADIKFTNGDINDFRKAANFATDLFKSNKGKLMGSYANMEPFRIVNCLFEALESSGADLKKVKPHWLCNSVMQKQLPQYLYQSAIFQDIDCSAKEKAPHYYNFGEPFRG
jgi:hypothetical protein